MPHLRQQKFNDALTALEKALIGTAVEKARMWARVAFFFGFLSVGAELWGIEFRRKLVILLYAGCNMVQWR